MQPRDTLVAEVQRWALVAALAGSALAFGPRGGLDAGSISKATIVVLAAIVAAAAAGVGMVRARRASVTWHLAVAVAVAFAGALLVRGLVADHTALALVGPIGRDNGVALYLACLVLFLVAAARADARTWALLAYGWVATGLVVALSAIDEATVRLGPDWAERPGVAGTLGNANFLAAWAGLTLPVALVVALDTRRPRPWRLTAAVLVPLLLIATGLSGSLQGLLVVAAVVTVFALVWALDHVPAARWRLLAGGAALVALVGGALVVLGAAGVGPGAFLRAQVGVRLRAEYWAAGARMFRDSPLTGIGPAKFLDHYRQARTPEAAQLVDLMSSSDSAHNVPLHLFAEGGVVIGVLYVAFLVSVAWALWRALASRQGPDRLWVGALGAAWVGYVLQSLVSIDVPQLAVVGWLLAGAIVGAAAPLRWFGAAPATGKRKGRKRPPPIRPWQHATSALVVVLALAATWLVIIPYRADDASAHSEIENRRSPERRSADTAATRLAPYQVSYRIQLAQALTSHERTDAAESVMLEAMERNPDSFEVMLNGARLAVANDDLEAAWERYERARELEPHHPDLAVEMAKVAHEMGEDGRAQELLAEALAVDPDHDEAQVLLDDL